MAGQFRTNSLAGTLVVLLGTALGCSGGTEEAANQGPDTTTAPAAVGPAAPAEGVAPGDSTGPAALDSVVPETVADTGVLTARDLVIDSLRVEIAALRREISPGAVVQNAAADSAGQLDGGVVALTGERVRETAEGLRHVGLRTFWSLILVGFAWVLVRLSVWLLELFAERAAARRLFFKKLIPIARLLVWSGVAYYIVTGVFQVDRSGMLAATAALGVGIGFAAQGVLKNFIGGLIVIFDQPFQVGDKIAVGGTYGEVVSIGMRSTRIVTPDDSLVTVPNAQVVEEQVSNANAGELYCQVVVDLYLPGWVDVRRAKAIAHDAAANSKYVYLGKPIVVLVADEFKETFLTHLKVKSYVLDTRYETALASDVTERAKTAFLAEGMLWPMAGQRKSFEHYGDGSERPRT